MTPQATATWPVTVAATPVKVAPEAERAAGAPATGAAQGTAGITVAPPWRRLVAFGVDALVLTLVTGALWGRLLASFASRMAGATSIDPGAATAHGAVGRVFGHTVGPYLMVLAATVILAILYYWLLTGYWGTTIGKRSVGIWVVSAGDLAPVSLRASLLRALIFVAGGEVLPLFFLADNGWLLGDQRRQALHDKAARTLVVLRTPPRPGRDPQSAAQ